MPNLQAQNRYRNPLIWSAFVSDTLLLKPVEEKFKFKPFMINVQNHIETSQLIDNADQLIGVYLTETLSWTDLSLLAMCASILYSCLNVKNSLLETGAIYEVKWLQRNSNPQAPSS